MYYIFTTKHEICQNIHDQIYRPKFLEIYVYTIKIVQMPQYQ